MFVFNCGNGRLHCPGTFCMNGRILFLLDSAVIDSTRLNWSQSHAGIFCAESGGSILKIKTSEEKLIVELENNRAEPVYLNDIIIRFSPSEIESPPSSENYLEYIHGFNFAQPSGVKKVGLPGRIMEHNPESSIVYLLREISSGASIMFSTLPPHMGDYLSFRALHSQPHGQGCFGVEIKSRQRCSLLPGKAASISALQCRTGNNPLNMLETLGFQFSDILKRPIKTPVRGWNSWDYFAGAVTSGDLHKNHRLAAQRWGEKKLHIVIDEGWELQWGVWEPNSKFPEGLDGFCARVSEEGGVPGIWTAPLLVNRYSGVYLQHPEWFGRDDEGLIVSHLYSYGSMAYLDVTRPEVEQWLYENFLRLKKAGFKYFKVDFTAEILKCNSFYDKAVPRGQIIRSAFETIRRAIGEDSYLLACGAPYESVIGIADASRVSGDIHNFWSNVLRNVPEITARWWMNGHLWNNDPDFLIVRTAELSRHPRLNREGRPEPFVWGGWNCGREMNVEEVKAYALLVYLSNGELFLSDDLTSMTEDGLAVLDRIMKAQPLSRTAVPVDLFAGHDLYPEILLAESQDRWCAGIFNWSENKTDKTLSLKQLGIGHYREIRSFWDGAELKITNGALDVALKPRSCAGLEIMK